MNAIMLPRTKWNEHIRLPLWLQQYKDALLARRNPQCMK